MGWLSAYSASEKRSERKTSLSAVGGVCSHDGGCAPEPPNSLILRSLHLATRYKSGDFVERDPCEMPNLPDSQIFNPRFFRAPGIAPPIKIEAGSFLPGTLPSALYPARHPPFPSFRELQAVPIFAGTTENIAFINNELWQIILPPPMSFSQ